MPLPQLAGFVPGLVFESAFAWVAAGGLGLCQGHPELVVTLFRVSRGFMAFGCFVVAGSFLYYGLHTKGSSKSWIPSSLYILCNVIIAVGLSTTAINPSYYLNNATFYSVLHTMYLFQFIAHTVLTNILFKQSTNKISQKLADVEAEDKRRFLFRLELLDGGFGYNNVK